MLESQTVSHSLCVWKQYASLCQSPLTELNDSVYSLLNWAWSYAFIRTVISIALISAGLLVKQSCVPGSTCPLITTNMLNQPCGAVDVPNVAPKRIAPLFPQKSDRRSDRAELPDKRPMVSTWISFIPSEFQENNVH